MLLYGRMESSFLHRLALQELRQQQETTWWQHRIHDKPFRVIHGKPSVIPPRPESSSAASCLPSPAATALALLEFATFLPSQNNMCPYSDLLHTTTPSQKHQFTPARMANG
jgi:hypothetical protein